MWIFDEFTGLWYYDELDTPAGTSYVQTGNCIVYLTGGSQEWGGDFSQNIDVLLGIYSSTTQELLPPGGPQAYTQQGNQIVLFLGDAPQEYIPANAGADGQSGNVVVVVTAGGYQAYRGGGNPGDVVHTADIFVSLYAASDQLFTPPELVRLATAALEEVRAFGAATVTSASFAFNTSNLPISRITLDFTSSDDLFNDAVGPAGGEIYVELSMTGAPLVSVLASAPIAEFFDGQGDEFDALKAAIQAGALDIELRAYEALPSRVIGRVLGASALTVEALP